jgi:hypothetical protein
VFVDDVEQLQNPAVCGLVELEIERPHVVRALGPEPIRGAGRGSQTLALSLAVRHLEALLPPQALDLLAVGAPALVFEHLMGLAIAPALVFAAEAVEARSECVVSLAARDLTSLGGAMLADDPASPPFRQLETFLKHQDRTPPARRAQKFPFATSRSASISSSLSATIRLRRVFSLLKLLEALGVVGLEAAELLAPPVIGLLRDLEMLGDLGNILAFGQEPIGLS